MPYKIGHGTLPPNEMKFGEIPVSEAEGAILAHSVKHADGIFKKGRVLTKADLAAITTSHVFAARLDPGDVAENDAAAANASGPHARTNFRAVRLLYGPVLIQNSFV